MLTTLPARRRWLPFAALAGALFSALAVTLFAFFAPIPRMLSGEEDLTAEQMPAIRSTVEQARSPFLQAQSRYMDYVHTHDVSVDLTNLQQAIDNARKAASNPALTPQGRLEAMTRLRDAALPAMNYMDVLLPYAQAGEPYFSRLHGYDDSLMGWSRSLGSRLEELKVDTRPIADYLRLYPPPVGDLSPNPPWMEATQVATYRSQLQADLTSTQSALSAPATLSNGTLGSSASALARDLDNVRASGTSIERIESLHAGYYNVLTTYDGQVQRVVASAAPEGSPFGGWLLANGLNVAVGLLTLAGLAALFTPRRKAGNL